MRFTAHIRSIRHLLVSGEPLLLLPTCLLVRWHSPSDLPEIGISYHYKTITVSDANIENVHRILRSPDPLARCDASKHVPLHVLARLYSYSQAKNMRRVAESLCPEVRELILAGAPTSLRRLFRVAYGESPEEQLQRWNESVKRSTRPHPGAEPASSTWSKYLRESPVPLLQ